MRSASAGKLRLLVFVGAAVAACGEDPVIADHGGDGTTDAMASASTSQAGDTPSTMSAGDTADSGPPDTGTDAGARPDTSATLGSDGAGPGEEADSSSGLDLESTSGSTAGTADATALTESGEPSSTGSPSTGAGTDSDPSTSGTADTEATEGASGTGGVAGPAFVDVTIAAGFTHDQGIPPPAGACLIDAINPPIAGLVCSPERYSGGAAVVDFDGDGRLDVFITRPWDQDLLYRNQGDGTFVDVAEAVGIVGTLGTAGAAFADVDGDGDQDLYITTVGDYRHYLFIQEDGVFTEQGEERGAAIPSVYQHSGSTVAFADYDLDGYLDIYVGEWRTHAVGTHPSHSRLLRNLGAEQPGYFEDVTLEAGIDVDDVYLTVDGNIDGTFVLSVGWSDLDGDGYPDLMLASDFAASRLFWNSGDGTFIDGTVASGVGTDENGMGSTAADYDNDGDFDWFVTSIVNPNKTGNRLYRNDGDRQFTDVTDEAGVRESGWGWGAAFFDHDLDGDLDLAATNGWYATAALEDPTVVWTNYDGAYVPEQDLLGVVDIGQGRALVPFDADDDGDLDLLIVNNRDSIVFYRNDTPTEGRHWLRVRAPGVVSNPDGIGAIVRVQTPGLTQTQEIGGTSHYLGHGAREAHFGLDVAATADVRVDWPATGAFVELADVPADQVLVVLEP